MRARILNASAGSGKTYQLAYKYVRDVVEQPSIYRHILAVTFTNKATEEMKYRILKEIHLLASGGESSYLENLCRELDMDAATVRRRAAEVRSKILHDYSRFTVLTIDTFFQRILRAFIKELGIDLNYNVENETASVLSKGDATLIEQVLLNLLENVAKHSPSATEVFIEIRAEGRRVWLTVADNGDGIPPQLLGVLFDGYLPLGAVEASDRSRHMGSGLSVCRAIVRAHGGEIYARNKIDGGAEFRFWLPAEEESNT